MLKSFLDKIVLTIKNTDFVQNILYIISKENDSDKYNYYKQFIFHKHFGNHMYYKRLAKFAYFTRERVLLLVDKTTTGSTSTSQSLGESIAIRFKTNDVSENVTSTISSFFKKNQLFYFLRKHKLFNKGRFSRNRQTYRTGAYWCLWVNIIAVTGFYYWFYRFSMKFGYLWPFFSLFILSFIIPRAIKYNYFHLSNVSSSIFKLSNWFYLLSLNFLSSFSNIFLNFFFFFKKSSRQKISDLSFPLFFVYNFIFKSTLNLLLIFNFLTLKIYDNKDLMIKIYSHWNYFLPLRWINKSHRSFFYKRIYFIIFS